MKNAALKVLLIITIISSLFLCGLLYLLSRKGNGKGEVVSKLQQFQDNYKEHATDTMTISPNVYYDFSVTDTVAEIYDVARNQEVFDRVEALKQAEDYTENNPLLIHNPYGTDALSLYVYYKTDKPVKTSYRCSVQGGEAPTFSAVCRTASEYSQEHEYLFLGLGRGNNRVSISMTDENGDVCVRTFYVNVETTFGQEKEKLMAAKGGSSAALASGLYALLGNYIDGKSLVMLYDNDGALRGEIPLISGECRRLIFSSDLMYYNVSDTQIAAIDCFGKVERVLTVDGYTIGKDFIFEETGNRFLMLATKDGGDGSDGVNDRVIELSLITGETRELVYLGDLLKEYKESCSVNDEGILEWINLNAIVLMENNGLLLSAREPSALIRISDFDTLPILNYLIGDGFVFDGTGYEGDLLSKSGSFDSFFGQSAIGLIPVENAKKGVYSFYVFDNHIGVSKSRPELDYSESGAKLGSSMKKGDASYFVTYTMNETARNYAETERIELAYTGYEGAAQILANKNLVTTCAARFTYTEYDSARQPICTFTAHGDSSLERVYKYDFQGFYFIDPAVLASETKKDTKDSKN